VIWVLCDYGEVISLGQPLPDRLALEQEAGRVGEEFWFAYWHHRPGYDRGTTGVADYWSAVLGIRPDRRKLARLIELDVAGWLHTNSDTLAATERAAARGLRLAILSNAPHEVADAIDVAPWANAFSPRLFSSRLLAVKPEREIYAETLRLLGADPEQVTFFDDRPSNVEEARRSGMSAHVFNDPAQIDAIELGASSK
jgi:putative hydrolase of the HAD superfamily